VKKLPRIAESTMKPRMPTGIQKNMASPPRTAV
jgi:hypothetical protein